MKLGIITVGKVLLEQWLNLPNARILSVWQDIEVPNIYLTVSHPEMPDVADGGVIPFVELQETVETCEHGNVATRITVIKTDVN